MIPGRIRGLSPVILAGLLFTFAVAGTASAAISFQSPVSNAQNGGGSNSLTINKPSGVSDGDLLLAQITFEKGSDAGSDAQITPSGWTLVRRTNRGTDIGQAIFHKVVTDAATEPASYTWNFTNSPKVAGGILRYSGVDTANPIIASSGGTGDSSTLTAPSVASEPNSMLVALFGLKKKDTTMSTPTGMTNPPRYLFQNPNDVRIMATDQLGPANPTGNRVSNAGSGDKWVAQLVTLRVPSDVTLSSAANQTFTLGDPPTPVSALTVTDVATPTITAAQDIRIRIPATFSMTWDTSVTTVTLGGTAAGKVSATLLAYEDSDKTAVLNVTADFASSDQLTITGLKFRDFTTTEAADNLELVVAGAGGATAATDDKTITIVSVDVTSAGSRILNDDAGRTPVAAEDVDVTNWDENTRFLVTIGIQTRNNSGARCESNQGTNRLQWRNVTDAPGTWNNLGTAAGPEMILFNSSNLVDNNSLTSAEAQIVGTGTYINGKEAENNNDKSWSRFEDGEHSAIQFSIDPSGGIAGKTYQFRFVVNGSLCDAGSNVMSVSITLAVAPPPPVADGFNAFETSTAPGAITGVIRTKVAGTAFSLDVVAIASGAQANGFTDDVKVELLANTGTPGSGYGADNCPTSNSVIQTIASAAISAGRSTVNFSAVADVYRDMRVRISHPTVSPTIIGCSTDSFAIRPASFSIAVTDNDWQTAGTGRALTEVTFGTVTHKAGRPFSVRATAINAAGTPATTTNYAGAPAATLTACAGAACTATFGTLTLGTTFAAGQLTSDAASYDNVGSFRLELVDASFAGVDAADSSALEREIRSATIDVGRFVPDHFAVSLNTPQFGTACGSFTYQGQPFTYATVPVITVTAQDFANNATTLYDGAWWRITNASLAPGTQAARYSAAGSVTLDVAALPDTNADPAIAVSGNGVGTLSFSSTGGIAFSRTVPVAPFDADIALAVDVIDADGVAFAGNPAKFGDATAGNGIAFSAGKIQRFGRLRLQNAYGPESVGLRIPLETQYWNGSGFVLNTQDSCTTLNREHVALSGYTLGLNACDTAVNEATVTLSGGQATLTLGAAGAGNSGTVLLSPVLGAVGAEMYCPAKNGTETGVSSAALAYLQGAWTGVTWNENPTGQATFGLYGSQPKNFIFFRENY